MLGERYAITETPAVLITNPEGRLVFLMQGFKDANDFYAHAHKDIDAYRKFALAGRRAGRQDPLGRGGVLDRPRALRALRLRRRGRSGSSARPTRPGVTPEMRESALLGLAAAERQLGHMNAARGAAQKVVATTKNADQKERAELFLAELALAENKPGDALAAYRKFAKDHPNSPYLEKVRGFIAKLEAGGAQVVKRALTAAFALAWALVAAARADGPPDPASLLKVTAAVAPGASATQGTLVVHAKLAAGWHVNSHHALGGLPHRDGRHARSGARASGSASRSIPEGKSQKFAFSETPLSVYAEEFTIEVPVEWGPGAAPALSGAIEYQACNDTPVPGARPP